MATSTEEILIRMGLEMSDVKKGMESVHGAAQSWAGKMARTFAGAFAFGSVVSQINQVISTFDDLKDRADNLGVGTDFLQGMSKIAKGDAVGGVETFNKAISELSVRLGTAKNGGKDAIASFEKFGITLDQIQSLDSEGMFYLIADKISAIPDPSRRAAAAFELLGKAGKNMVGVMSNGADALREMVNQTEKLDAAGVKALASYKDKIDNWGNWFGVWKAKIVVGLAELVPSLGKIFNYKGMVADAKAGGAAASAADQAARAKKIDDDLEAERLKSLENGQKRVAAAADYAQRAAEGKAAQEKAAAETLEKQVSLQKQLTSLYKRATEIKNDAARVSASMPTVENLAGRDFTAQLNADYGAGGRFDLGKGDGYLGGAARGAMQAGKQMEWDLTYGNGQWVEGKDGQPGHFTGQAEQDRKRKMKFENMLGAAGLDTPTQKLESMKQSLTQIQSDITALYTKAAGDGITINTKD